jgi:hypothetical protein
MQLFMKIHAEHPLASMKWSKRDSLFVLSLLLSGLLLLHWEATVNYNMTFLADSPSILIPRKGMYGTEQFPNQNQRYRWTKGKSQLQFPTTGGSSFLSMVLAGGPGRTVPIRISTIPVPTTRISFFVSPEPRTYSFLLPQGTTERITLQITSPTMRDPKDNKQQLGIVLSTIRTYGQGTFSWTRVGLFLLASLTLYGIMRQRGIRPWFVAISILFSQAGFLLWHTFGGWHYGISNFLLTILSITAGGGWLAIRCIPRNRMVIGILVVVPLLLTLLPIIAVQTCSSLDYYVHIGEAVRMQKTGTIGFPHFLFQVSLLAIQIINPEAFFQLAFYTIKGVVPFFVDECMVQKEVTGLEFIAMVSEVGWYMLLGIITYRFLRIHTNMQRFQDKCILVLSTWLLIIATPISLLYWLKIDSYVYLGYTNLQTYHNPTINIIKPIAILLFWYALNIFAERWNYPQGVVLTATAILTVLSAIAKPNYIICLVPALMVYAGIRFLRQRRFSWLLLFLGVLVPAGGVLVWQFTSTYVSNTPVMTQSSIAIAPFVVISYISSWLLPKFFLSILFPLCVYLLYIRQSMKNTMLNLAWLVFLFGAFYAYFLIETGIRKYDVNFLWSAQISLFVLFVASTAFFLGQNQTETFLYRKILADKRAIVSFVVLGIHAICGVFYYFLVLGWKSLVL